MEDAERASTVTVSAERGLSPATAKGEEEADECLSVGTPLRSSLAATECWMRSVESERDWPPGLTVKPGCGHLYANPGCAAAGK